MRAEQEVVDVDNENALNVSGAQTNTNLEQRAVVVVRTPKGEFALTAAEAYNYNLWTQTSRIVDKALIPICEEAILQYYKMRHFEEGRMASLPPEFPESESTAVEMGKNIPNFSMLLPKKKINYAVECSAMCGTERHDLSRPFACEHGICQSCLTTMLRCDADRSITAIRCPLCRAPFLFFAIVFQRDALLAMTEEELMQLTHDYYAWMFDSEFERFKLESGEFDIERMKNVHLLAEAQRYTMSVVDEYKHMESAVFQASDNSFRLKLRRALIKVVHVVPTYENGLLRNVRGHSLFKPFCTLLNAEETSLQNFSLMIQLEQKYEKRRFQAQKNEQEREDNRNDYLKVTPSDDVSSLVYDYDENMPLNQVSFSDRHPSDPAKIAEEFYLRNSFLEDYEWFRNQILAPIWDRFPTKRVPEPNGRPPRPLLPHHDLDPNYLSSWRFPFYTRFHEEWRRSTYEERTQKKLPKNIFPVQLSLALARRYYETNNLDYDSSLWGIRVEEFGRKGIEGALSAIANYIYSSPDGDTRRRVAEKVALLQQAKAIKDFESEFIYVPNQQPAAVAVPAPAINPPLIVID